MRHIIRTALVGAILLGPAAGFAHAVTVRDLVELRRAGLSDDVLIALIESEGTVFHLTSADVLSLRTQLSERVIIFMLRTAKPAVAVQPAVEPTRQTQQEQVVEPPAPVVVKVQQTVTQTVEQPAPSRTRTEYVPVAVAVPVFIRPPVIVTRPEPVYWGYGGQRRPDSWQDAPKPKVDEKVPPKGRGGS